MASERYINGGLVGLNIPTRTLHEIKFELLKKKFSKTMSALGKIFPIVSAHAIYSECPYSSKLKYTVYFCQVPIIIYYRE